MVAVRGKLMLFVNYTEFVESLLYCHAVNLQRLLFCRTDGIENTTSSLAVSKPKHSDPIALKEKFIHAKVLYGSPIVSV